MEAKNHTTNDASPDDYSDLEIVIDPDEIVGAVAADGKYPERNGGMAITVRPPFDGECRGKSRFNETGTYWPPEMDPKPLDLSPEHFHDAEFGYPQSWEINEAAKEVADVEHIADVPRDVWDECRDVQVEIWESELRNSLKAEIDINEFGYATSEFVPIRYENTDE